MNIKSTPPPLLCAGNPLDLASAVGSATGLLRNRIDHFLWVARNREKYPDYEIERMGIVSEGLVRPMVRPNESAYCFLAYLLTGDEEFAAQGRSRLFDLADSVEARERGDWTQLHNWCDAFPFARWLILYDWIWDSPVFTAQDRERLEERFLYYLWAHPYQRLLARHLAGTPCNNQNAAMALACVIGGYFFGVKRGNSDRARKLLAKGIPHLEKFVTSFPRGGYSYEGSNYMAGVNSFIIPFAMELLEAAGGVDVLDRRESENCASPREVLQSIMRLATPGGSTLPWDCAGFARAEFTPAAAYLAFRTGSTGALDFLDSIGAVEQPSHMGWGFDKTLWTLLWTLRAEVKREGDVPWTLNHAEPTIGAGAHGPASRLFIFQMWDRSEWPPGRAQFNPNSIIMEFDGAPLLLDGQCVEMAKKEKFQRPEYLYFRGDIQEGANFGIGTVGAHNSMIFDGEEHFAPHGSTEGKLVFSCYLPEAALFESDVTDCYRSRYDVRSVRRSSLVLGDELVLVRDRIESETPHQVTWRVHTRDGQIQSGPGYLAVTTPEQIRLEICIPGSQTVEHVPFPSLPQRDHLSGLSQADDLPCGTVLPVLRLEERCLEVSHHARGTSLTLFTLLVPTSGVQVWKMLDSRWQWLVRESQEQVDTALQHWPGGQPIDFSSASWFYHTSHHEPGIGVYRCEFDVAERLPDDVWLELPRLLRSSRVRVNGREFPINIGHEEQQLLPHRIPIRGTLKNGANVVEIISPSTLESALRGEVRLLVPAPNELPSRLVQRDKGTLELHHHGVCDVVTWNDHECQVQRSNGQSICLPFSQVSSPPEDRGLSSPPLPLVEQLPQANDCLSFDRAAILTGLAGNDWQTKLDALEKAAGTTDKAILDEVWKLLQHEVETHETLVKREPDDVCWYRLKAAAARVLGAARFEPATEVLGEMLLGVDIYPARVASAWALGQVATPRALELLSRVAEEEEWNTAFEVKSGLKR